MVILDVENPPGNQLNVPPLSDGYAVKVPTSPAQIDTSATAT